MTSGVVTGEGGGLFLGTARIGRRKSMPVLFVARSVKLGRWGSDVGLGKHVYKVGVADDDPKTLAATGWAGESDWKIVRTCDVEGLSEEEALQRLSRKERMIDP